VIAVSAARATALLDRRDDVPLEMGNVVKMPTRAGTVYGMVSRLEVVKHGLEPSQNDQKLAEIEFAGEVGANETESAFRPGASAFPVLDAPVWMATAADLRTIYAPPQVATAQIGSLHQDARIPADILIDQLLGRHFSIVGSTSSGKSCLVAAILGAVLEQAPNAHIVLLDPHGEYGNALGEYAEVLSPGDRLYFPYWLFTFEDRAGPIHGPPLGRKAISALVSIRVVCSHPFGLALRRSRPQALMIFAAPFPITGADFASDAPNGFDGAR
jgi:hypothetical protein